MSLLNKKEADEIVIENLLKEIARLKGVNNMSKIIKSVDGKYYLVHQGEELEEDEAREILEQINEEKPLLEEMLNAQVDNTEVATEEVVEAQPVEAAQPVETPEEAAPEQPAPEAPVAPEAVPTEAAPAEAQQTPPGAVTAPDPNSVNIQ